MEFQPNEIICIGKANIKVTGLANIGLSPVMGKSEQIGSFSTPRHQLPGVYAGVATHNPKGNQLSTPIRVLILCNKEDQQINIKRNDVLGTFIASADYSNVNIQQAALSQSRSRKTLFS